MITVTGESLDQIKGQLALHVSPPPIAIRWRKSTDFDGYEDRDVSGCVVTAQTSDAVPLVFETNEAALEHIRSLLDMHEKWIQKHKAVAGRRA